MQPTCAFDYYSDSASQGSLLHMLASLATIKVLKNTLVPFVNLQ